MLGLLTAGALLLVPRAPSCVTSDRRVEDVVTAKVRELQGHEYCQFRIYETLSDADGDGIEDFLLVFSVEGAGGGGNSTIQFLAVFPSGTGWRPVVAEVGLKGKTIVESIVRGPGRAIRLKTLEYGPGDASCCPSRKGEVRLVLRDGEIRSADK